jgi:hypothetical protein
LRDRRICFTFNAREQQILRCAQDDILGEEFFSSLLGSSSSANIYADVMPGAGYLVAGHPARPPVA